MTTQTTHYPQQFDTGNDSPGSFSLTESVAKMDQRVSLHPLSGEEALSGLLATREIDENPEQAARLDSARKHASEGKVRWLDEDEESLSTDSE